MNTQAQIPEYETDTFVQVTASMVNVLHASPLYELQEKVAKRRSTTRERGVYATSFLLKLCTV